MQMRYSTWSWRVTVGTALALLGVSLWVAAVVLQVTPADARVVTFPHFEIRLLAIVTGGAMVAGGIILLATG
jgi:hypothetical protein